MNVLIIPEDFRNDQYILKPLFVRLFADLGKRNASVEVCKRPLMGGISEAINIERLRKVVDLYPMVDIFILCVDRDGDVNRRQKLDRIEEYFSASKQSFLAENAWEELETWALAGLDLPKSWSWSEVRGETSVKEVYFETLAKILEVSDGPGGGRRHLGVLAARKLDAIALKCSEDFGVLAQRIRAFLEAT